MIYIYKHPKKEKYLEVVQGVHEVHEYFDKKGLKWERVFTAPNIGIDTKIDEFSQAQFIDKTKNAKGSIGDLMDRSRELSEKRASRNGGVDPIKQKFFDNYAKERKNKRHPSDPKRYEKLNNLGGGIENTVRKVKKK